MSITFRRVVEPICRSSSRHPAAWLLAVLLLSVPAALEFRNIRLDTNLVRLIDAGGLDETLPLLPKEDVASRILDWVAAHRPRTGARGRLRRVR